jgi:hypothetical protein
MVAVTAHQMRGWILRRIVTGGKMTGNSGPDVDAYYLVVHLPPLQV